MYALVTRTRDVKRGQNIEKQKHTKYTQINTNKFMHSEMGPV